MSELLNKLSSYNIFNYLFPGVMFAILVDKLGHYSLIQQDILTGLFLYYFFGLVISRIGSLVLEPLLKRFSFLRFADYKAFVTASKIDSKLELLSEINNTYRTLSALFVLLLLLRLFDAIEGWYPVLAEWNQLGLVVALLVMFLLSYRKQTGYITKRVLDNQ